MRWSEQCENVVQKENNFKSDAGRQIEINCQNIDCPRNDDDCQLGDDLSLRCQVVEVVDRDCNKHLHLEYRVFK